ncbi:extracellular solute-binding protein family 1 [Methanocaldococcus infernus ME]|uniref:Extracellular solute-binding protein family 1 n=1 Tax=Methanocaldococcus infernus (strain DSM 11812 / JCM 15783 / ME) TaxID=573063 RepID=D5VU87_METIM|nr:extracellular solute-binding protein [Methanocaldococcus infernus]ADG12699.1 extracellular solute-binding protein family 1 [Methanocaldococcus infernus ME]
MRHVKIFVILMIGMIICSIISGCVNNETTSKSSMKNVELTGNFKKDVINIGKTLENNGIKVVKFSVWGAGDPNSVMRVYGIVEAANRINKIWEDNGIDVKIKVDTYYVSSFQNLYKDYLSKQPLGMAGDFFVNSYVYVPILAKEGYILNINEYVKKYEHDLSDYYPVLLKVCKYNGEFYALPQDTEVRPLYINKKVAEKIGIDIKNFPKEVEEGKITWSDIYNYAKKAKNMGLVKWGILHRKGSAHPDLIQFIYAFNGTLYDKKNNKLVLDVPAVYKWLYVEWKFARDRLIPKDMMVWDWRKQIHPTVLKGETLFWIGGSWNWAEWQTKNYVGKPFTAEELRNMFSYSLFPAGERGCKPVTLSQPFVWMINSKVGEENSKYNELKDVYQKLAFLMVLKANDPDINAIHCIISAHLPIREKAAKLLENDNWINKVKNLDINFSPEVKNSIKDIVKRTVNPINAKFLASLTYMLNYTHFAPSHPEYPALADIFTTAVDKVLRGEMTPKEAIEFIIQKINANPDLKQNTEIIGKVPKNWKFPQ